MFGSLPGRDIVIAIRHDVPDFVCNDFRERTFWPCAQVTLLRVSHGAYVIFVVELATADRSKFLARALLSPKARAGILLAFPTLGEMTMKIKPRGMVDVHSRDGSIKNRACPYFDYAGGIWFAWWDDQSKKTKRPDRIISMDGIAKRPGPSHTVDIQITVDANALNGKSTSYHFVPKPYLEFD